VFINGILIFIGLIFDLFDISIFNTVFCDNDLSSDVENKNEVNNKEETNKIVASLEKY
jgi:hypothetical protein